MYFLMKMTKMNEDKKQAYDELCELAEFLYYTVRYENFGADECDMKLASEYIRDAYNQLRVGEEEDED